MVNSLRQLLVAFVLIAVLPLVGATGVLAEEVITSYTTDITLRDNGSVRVVETITVNAEGRSIRRGIYRDIPTVLIRPDDSKLYSTLTVNAVQRDGEDEPYRVTGIENGERIYIGDSDVLLDTPATYTYTIDYEMTRMARRFEDYDELYFNAIGQYWDFPIETAVVLVSLPAGAVITDLQGYTGKYGANEQAVTITRESNYSAIFRATRPLAAYEGMTISASFEKGALAAPSPTDGALNYLSDKRTVLVPAFAALMVLLYNLLTWLRVGRDPPKGTVIPRFHPPQNLSPALTHFIHKMGWRRSGWLAFTAGLIDMAVKGLLVLGKDRTRNTITETGEPAPDDLPPEEAKLYAYFEGMGTVRIDKTMGPKLARQLSVFKKAAIGPKGNIWFRNNGFYIVGSLVLSAVMLGLMLWAGVIDPVVIFISFFLTVFLTVIITVVGSALSGGWIARVFLLFWFGVVFINVGGSLASMASDLLNGMTIGMPLIALASIVVANVLFGILMRAPTVEGRRVMDEIEGFKMYLETAEQERLNFAGEPQMSVSRFETILPYAVALGVEKPWTERFESDLARNAVSDYEGGHYRAHWHTGTDFQPGSMGRDVAAFASGMSAAMIASQPTSSSSSGSSGGGSSGGGGGGGGGGGW